MPNFLTRLFRTTAPTEAATLSTPYGTLNLARKKDREAAKGLLVQIQRSTDALTRKDIGDWRQAWQLAINAENPNRAPLYDIYRDVQIDLHLSGCIEQRKGFVLSREFKIEGKDGKRIDGAHAYFDQTWFKQFADLLLETPYWGHTLIELGDVAYRDGKPYGFESVALIPRKHVLPEWGRVVLEVGADAQSGIKYREPPLSDNLIEIGTPYDLGLFLKAATQTIAKKNTLGFWDTFAEVFGMPMRIARTATRNPSERLQLENMLRYAGAAQYMLASLDTEIEFKESSRGDAYNVYDKRIDRANSELSKLIIGQTMTIEDGSSLSQSETHLEVFENLVDKDRDLLRDIVNNQLLPRMVAKGFPLQGARFEWNTIVDYTPEEKLRFEAMIADRYEVDPTYFEEKYGVPIIGKKENPTPPDDGNDKKAQKAKLVHPQNPHSDFFD